MQKIQPRIRELQKIHKDDKERQAKELMALHKEHDLNPFSSLLLIIIQLPIIFALYKVIRESLASQVFTNHLFLGIWSVGQTSLALTLLASALQYIQGRLSLAAVPKSSGDDKEKTMASAGRTLVYLGPLFTFIVLYRLPVAIGIYWATSTLFSVAQQVHINEKLAHIRNEEKK
jgi:YidC/Oxa1 family membrane protein insertase